MDNKIHFPLSDEGRKECQTGVYRQETGSEDCSAKDCGVEFGRLPQERHHSHMCWAQQPEPAQRLQYALEPYLSEPSCRAPSQARVTLLASGLTCVCVHTLLSEDLCSLGDLADLLFPFPRRLFLGRLTKEQEGKTRHFIQVGGCWHPRGPEECCAESWGRNSWRSCALSLLTARDLICDVSDIIKMITNQSHTLLCPQQHHWGKRRCVLHHPPGSRLLRMAPSPQVQTCRWTHAPSLKESRCVSFDTQKTSITGLVTRKQEEKHI